ncbi:uncharacterized protein LOC131885096 isoform X2 [Tigriopus californicus]|uniref:uncharacterized protein LOC131885096 isoform X2 n=1 Tax=Tigriopus californicus TaxID=6832 RepID=UPI0027D9EACE|nr:uncharacterized protein LOC131885096 isoform X2 [Tigriopus californicus]
MMMPPPGWQDEPHHGKAKPVPLQPPKGSYPASTLRRKSRTSGLPSAESDTYPPPPRRFATQAHAQEARGPPPPVPSKPVVLRQLLQQEQQQQQQHRQQQQEQPKVHGLPHHRTLPWTQHQEQLRHELQRELAHRRRSKSASSSERRNRPSSPDVPVARKSATLRHLSRHVSPPPPPYHPLPPSHTSRTLPLSPPGRPQVHIPSTTDWLRAFQKQQIKSFDQLNRRPEVAPQLLPAKARAKDFIPPNVLLSAAYGDFRHPTRSKEPPQDPRNLTEKHHHSAVGSSPSEGLSEALKSNEKPPKVSVRAKHHPGRANPNVDPSLPTPPQQHKKRHSIKTHDTQPIEASHGDAFDSDKFYAKQRQLEQDRLDILERLGLKEDDVADHGASPRKSITHRERKSRRDTAVSDKLKKQLVGGPGPPSTFSTEKRDLPILGGHHDSKHSTRNDRFHPMDELRRTDFLPESATAVTMLDEMIGHHLNHREKSQSDRQMTRRPKTSASDKIEQHSRAKSKEKLHKRERRRSEREVSAETINLGANTMAGSTTTGGPASSAPLAGAISASATTLEPRSDRNRQQPVSSEGARRKSRGPSETCPSQSNEIVSSLVTSGPASGTPPHGGTFIEGGAGHYVKLEHDKKPRDHYGHPSWFTEEIRREEERVKSGMDGTGPIGSGLEMDVKKKERELRKRHLSEKKERLLEPTPPPLSVVPAVSSVPLSTTSYVSGPSLSASHSHHQNQQQQQQKQLQLQHYRNMEERRDGKTGKEQIHVDEKQRRGEKSRAQDSHRTQDHHREAREKRDKPLRAPDNKDRDQIALEMAQKDRLEQDFAQKERLARELTAKDKEARDLLERERNAREIAEKEKFAREMAEKERKAMEMIEKEQRARVMADKERERRAFAEDERREKLQLRLEKRLEEEILALQKQKKQLEREERHEREKRRRESCSGDRMRDNRRQSRDPSLARSEVVRRSSSKRDSSSDIVDAVEKILMWSTAETARKQHLEDASLVRDFPDGTVHSTSHSSTKRKSSCGPLPSPPCTCHSPSPTDSGNQETVLEVPVAAPSSHTWDHRSTKSSTRASHNLAGYASLPSSERRRRDSSYHVEAEIERHPLPHHPLLAGYPPRSKGSRAVSPSWDSRSRSHSHHTTLMRDLGGLPASSDISSSTRRHRSRRYSSKSYSYESDLDYERHLPSHGSRSCRCSIEHLDVEDEYSIYKPVFSDKSLRQEFGASGCVGLNGSSKSLTSTHPMLKESHPGSQAHHVNGFHNGLGGTSATTNVLSAILPTLDRAKANVINTLRGLPLRRQHWFLLMFIALFIFLGFLFGFSGSSKSTDDLLNSPALQQAAITKLLKEVPLIDGHNDLPWNIRKFVHNKLDSVNFTHNLKYVEPWAKSKWSHTDISRLMEGQVGCQLWVAYAPCGSQHKDAVQVTLEQIDLIKRLADAYPSQLQLVKTSKDIAAVHASGRIGSLITVESGHSIGTSLAVLRMFHRLGARSLTLTHNCHTPWADCSKADEPDGKPVHYGLTQFGRTVVEEMNRLGMIIDLSHSSIQTASDAIAVSDAPVIYSHSCAQKLCNSTRNIPDNLLRLVADKKGLVMVNFFSYFLTCNNHSTMNDVIAHLNHIRKVAGIDHVGIGASYDGINSTPAGLEDVSRYPALFVSLLASGTWSLDDLRKLAGLNFLRVFQEVERVASSFAG